MVQLMWKTQPAERTDAWPDAGRYAGRGEELANQAAAVSATKPCLRSILIQRGALVRTRVQMPVMLISWFDVFVCGAVDG